MKLSGAKVGSFLAKPDTAARAVLLYGPDLGQVQEFAGVLTKAVTGDPKDPFRVVELSLKPLKDDPACLADEAAAISMSGGRRVLRMADAADGQTSLLADFLAHPVGDAVLVITAGELPKRSTLRTLFENADNAAALACYGDEGRDLDAVIRETLSGVGVTLDREAADYLPRVLGGDRLTTRRELEKLALYMGHQGVVSLEDVRACVGDSAAMDIDELAFSTADGNLPAAQRALDRLLSEGTAPVGLIRGLSRHFQRLHLAAGAVALGETVDTALRRLKPPVFYKNADRFRAQLRAWSPTLLSHALSLLIEAEVQCKTTGFPDTAVCGRLIIQLARAAKRKVS